MGNNREKDLEIINTIIRLANDSENGIIRYDSLYEIFGFTETCTPSHFVNTTLSKYGNLANYNEFIGTWSLFTINNVGYEYAKKL